MSEWFKELVLKTSDAATRRGFESHSLRHAFHAPGHVLWGVDFFGREYRTEYMRQNLAWTKIFRCFVKKLLTNASWHDIMSKR